jgi:hypothetical protein
MMSKGAMPNQFEFVFQDALEQPGATAESVAAAIASSTPFLKAVGLGMAHVPAPDGIPTTAQMVLAKVAKALSAPTSGTMF